MLITMYPMAIYIIYPWLRQIMKITQCIRITRSLIFIRQRTEATREVFMFRTMMKDPAELKFTNNSLLYYLKNGSLFLNYHPRNYKNLFCAKNRVSENL